MSILAFMVRCFKWVFCKKKMSLQTENAQAKSTYFPLIQLPLEVSAMMLQNVSDQQLLMLCGPVNKSVRKHARNEVLRRCKDRMIALFGCELGFLDDNKTEMRKILFVEKTGLTFDLWADVDKRRFKIWFTVMQSWKDCCGYQFRRYAIHVMVKPKVVQHYDYNDPREIKDKTPEEYVTEEFQFVHKCVSAQMTLED